MSEKRNRRSDTEEFKKQWVELNNKGKPRGEMIREYELTGACCDRGVKRINATGSTKEKNNRSPEAQALLEL